ncbi:aquaporin-1 [Labrus bergylta]|uniref:aquaporin-1 n=1 Tax=Labrus bergylta TaxID=56723 RepID=UPI003313DE5B
MNQVAIMHIRRCLHLILTDIWTLSCLHHFLLEFLGTALFLSASLSAVLTFPLATGRQQLNLRSEGNQSNISNLFYLGNVCNQSNLNNLVDQSDLCNQSNLSSETNQWNLSNLCNMCIQRSLCNESNLIEKINLGNNQRKLCNHRHLISLPVSPPSCLQVALVFGLSLAMAAFCVGGEVHLNPAVTIVMLLTLRLRPWRAALYVIGQLLGGVASAALLLLLTGDVTPAVNQVVPGVQLHQAVTVETLATFQLALVVLAMVDASLPAVVSNMLVGLAVSLGHLIAVSVTGCGMNPARSFGPAVVTLDFNNHWVFWVGPGLGACLAALLNDLLLRPRWHRPRDWWAELKQLYVLTGKQQQMALSHSP